MSNRNAMDPDTADAQIEAEKVQADKVRIEKLKRDAKIKSDALRAAAKRRKLQGGV